MVSRPECVRVSYWKKGGQADYLVAVANWSDKPVDAGIVLPPALAGFAQCLDLESGETLKAGADWRLAVPPHDLRAFRFGSKAAQ